jgi:hypothetical protein
MHATDVRCSKHWALGPWSILPKTIPCPWILPRDHCGIAGLLEPQPTIGNVRIKQHPHALPSMPISQHLSILPATQPIGRSGTPRLQTLPEIWIIATTRSGNTPWPIQYGTCGVLALTCIQPSNRDQDCSPLMSEAANDRPQIYFERLPDCFWRWRFLHRCRVLSSGTAQSERDI